jgi:hypothetical protein
MLNLTRTRPTTITLDGQEIRLQIARLSITQAEDHGRRLAWLFACAERQKSVMAKSAEMTEDQACAEKERQEREDAENSAFAIEAITDYVSVESGQLAVDGVMVTTGAHLVSVIGDRQRVVMDVLMGISNGQTLTELIRKASASASASAPSSDAHGPAPDGPTLAPIAEPAAPAGTTESVAATAAMASSSSGSTGTSS